MWAVSRFLQKNCRFQPPDHLERRGDLCLLVWKDIPFWMTADGELLQLLESLNGGRSVREQLDVFHVAGSSRRSIVKGLRNLESVAIIHSDGQGSSALRKAALSSTPIENIAINPTRRCNLQCRFCYTKGQPAARKSEEISPEEIVRFLDSIRDLLSRRASITVLGGEPLLRPDSLTAIADWGRRRRITTIASTNGLAVSDDFCREAARLRLQVQVSLDGVDAPTHDTVRGTGSYGQAVSAVRRLVDARVHTVLSLVCHKGNVDQLEAYFALAAELGVKEARFIPLKQIGGGRGNGMEPVPLKELVRRAARLFDAHPEYRPLAGSDAFSILAQTCRYSEHKVSCGSGLQTFLLDADGSLYPCLNVCASEFRFGNIRDPGFDFRKTWIDSAVLRTHRRDCSMAGMSEECRRCPVQAWCRGGCHGESLVASGRVATPPPNCKDLREGILEVLWILSETPWLTGRRVNAGRC